MLLTVMDAAGITQRVIVQAQEAATNKSGTIAATSVSQIAIDANPDRSGWFIQNTSSNPMFVNDMGDASAAGGSFKVEPGQTFPPHGYPVGTGDINITGTAGDKFTAREW